MDFKGAIEALSRVSSRRINDLKTVAHGDVRANGGPTRQIEGALDNVGSAGRNSIENELETGGGVHARAQELHRSGRQAELTTEYVFCRQCRISIGC